jgi:glycosyltransferase involved in cell wall biosynthesis
MNGSGVVAVIPALNEAGTIAGVVRSLSPYVDSVVVVDDGSTDGTAEQAESAGASVVGNDSNVGYDASVSRGMAYAFSAGANVVVTIDADGQHNPSDIPRLLQLIESGEADIVVGNREVKPRFSEYLFSALARLRVGIGDPICGLKAVSRNAYESVGYFDRIGSIGSQIVFDANRGGLRVRELSIQVADRADEPRFGRTLSANAKIARGFCKVLWNEMVARRSS